MGLKIKIKILFLQWQAGSRQQAAPPGFEPDKSSWGWNWLERWMAVRPWENRFLDINLKDGVMVRENGSAEGKYGTKPQLKSAGKKPVSTIHSNISSQKTGASHSDGNSSSPSKSAAMVEASNTQLSKPKTKPHLEDQTAEGNSKPAVSSRSHSNPKERSTQTDKQAKKRLSLPNSSECSLPLSLPLSLSLYIYIYLFLYIICVEKHRSSLCSTFPRG